MATTTIPWNDGSGDNITLTYASASGNQTVTVSSDANTGAARSKVVTFTAGSLTKTLTINQEAAAVSTIPYIRGGTDGSYIDTGITADNTVKVIVWARNFNPTSGVLFGSRVALGSSSFSLGSYGGTGTGRIRLDYNNGQNYADNQFVNLSHYHKYELDGNTVKVDDITIITATESTFSNNLNIFLLSLNTNGVAGTNSLPIDISACKIYKNGVLVRDYTAVNTPSVGLYDAVSDTVFTNAGTGTLTYGTFDPNSYIPLEYVSCTNAQYIDTGIYGYASLPVVIKFQILGTTLANPNVFGTMRSGTSGTYFLLQGGNNSYKNRYMNFYIDRTTNNQIYNNNSTKLTNQVVVFVKDDTKARLVRNNAVFGTERTFTASSSFSTSPDTMMLATIRSGGNINTASAFNGYIYFAGFGAERNYVPAKVNGVAGLYETYSDTFKPSESSTAFVAGATI